MGSNRKSQCPPIIQTFPVDLLAEKMFLLSVSARLPPIIHLSAEPPMSLCHVCRSWRGVALVLPRLWTAIRVETRHEWTSRRVRRKQFIMGASPLVDFKGETFLMTLNFSFKRGSPKSWRSKANHSIQHFRRLIRSSITPARSPEIIVRFAISSMETVILRDIVDVYDESTAFLLPSGPARHLRLVGSSGLRALPFLSLLILNS